MTIHCSIYVTSLVGQSGNVRIAIPLKVICWSEHLVGVSCSPLYTSKFSFLISARDHLRGRFTINKDLRQKRCDRIYGRDIQVYIYIYIYIYIIIYRRSRIKPSRRRPTAQSSMITHYILLKKSARHVTPYIFPTSGNIWYFTHSQFIFYNVRPLITVMWSHVGHKGGQLAASIHSMNVNLRIWTKHQRDRHWPIWCHNKLTRMAFTVFTEPPFDASRHVFKARRYNYRYRAARNISAPVL